MKDRGTAATNEEIRIDKWLWAARLFKSRALAAEAVSGGKIHVNGARAKPSRTIRPGDELAIRRGPQESIVVVKRIARLRRPAQEAGLLYQESEASKLKRAAVAAQLKLERPLEFSNAGRPSKKDRRLILKITKRGW
jgi:ribosome-associated heat shock protein Hsp15